MAAQITFVAQLIERGKDRKTGDAKVGGELAGGWNALAGAKKSVDDCST
jgi:hypothetical protein